MTRNPRVSKSASPRGRHSAISWTKVFMSAKVSQPTVYTLLLS